MEMRNNAYLSNVLPSGEIGQKVYEQLEQVREGLGVSRFPHPDNFLSSSEADVVSGDLDRVGILSIGSFLHPQLGYAMDGEWQRDPEAKALWEAANRTRLQLSSVLENQSWGMMIGSDQPEKMIPCMEEHLELFGHVKFGIFRTVSLAYEGYRQVMEVISDRASPLPVNMHCNGSEDFEGICSWIEEFPNTPVMIGHAGGSSFEGVAEGEIEERFARILNMPKKVSVNLLVHPTTNLTIASVLKKERFEGMRERIVFATDVPFLDHEKSYASSHLERSVDIYARSEALYKHMIPRDWYNDVDRNTAEFLTR